ncbi:MAG: cytochrome P450 [Nocardia sp.]|nr:cytochrome P450 [Nocardia sp.]
MHELGDPYPFYERLRREDPVHRVGDSRFHLVATWDLVTEAATRTDDFSSNLTETMMIHPDGAVTGIALAPFGDAGHVLATGDDPAHRAHRKLALPALTAARVLALEPFVTATLEQAWTGGDRIDWVAAVAHRLPTAVVARLLGLSDCDPATLLSWTFAATQLLDGVVSADQVAAATVAATEMAGYLAECLVRALGRPEPGVLGDLARAVAEGTVSTGTAVLMLVQLVAAGGESTAALLGTAARVLATRPDLAAALRADPELIPVFVDEVLRLESPFRGHYRHVVADTALGGVELPAGSHLYLLWGSANRDPAVFDDPDEFRLDRRRSHLAFGRGIHFCVGAALARLEARAAIGMLLRETRDFTAVDPEPDWVPSHLVRRLTRLDLAITPARPGALGGTRGRYPGL